MARSRRQWLWLAPMLAALIGLTAGPAAAQEAALAWDAAPQFKYNIESVVVDHTVNPWQVRVVFSVSNPTTNTLWNIKSDVPFTYKSPVGAVQLSPGLNIHIGWKTSEYVNTGSRFDAALGQFSLAQAPFGTGIGAALPIRVNALATSRPCTTAAECPGVADLKLRYWIVANLPPQLIDGVDTGVSGSGVVGMDGHPVWPASGPTSYVPVKSEAKAFAITDPVAVARRQVVDINKCKRCHTNQVRDGHVIPRLSLHGGNRTEEPQLCVICHNPNQTDVPYRTVLSPPATDPLSSEMSVDFKRMVHGIHAGGFRDNPMIIIGRNGTVNDFSDVRFPSKLRNCVNCHIDNGRNGTFELPLAPGVLGSTVKTASELGILIDVNPTNNLRITPIASVCTSCHDDREVRRHMISKGALFGATQAQMTPNPERCVSCHGPGRDKDVRKEHLDD